MSNVAVHSFPDTKSGIQYVAQYSTTLGVEAATNLGDGRYFVMILQICASHDLLYLRCIRVYGNHHVIFCTERTAYSDRPAQPSPPFVGEHKFPHPRPPSTHTVPQPPTIDRNLTTPSSVASRPCVYLVHSGAFRRLISTEIRAPI